MNIKKSENLNQSKPYRLNPGEELPKDKLAELRAVNDSFSKKRDFQNYLQNLAKLFNYSLPKVTEENKRFLGGFMEGEASLNVSAKKLKNAQFGVLFDPEFSITQHVNGFATLLLALTVFQTGRIRHKTGSNATLVLIIDNRISLIERVIPFYNKYVEPYGSPWKKERKEVFLQVLQLFKEEKHKDFASFRDTLLPLWDSLRMQRGQINETFASLEAAQKYVDQHVADQKK